MSSAIPTKEGWLEKRGDWGFRWSKRYFRLTTDGLLSNYSSDAATERPKGTFRVAEWTYTAIELKGKPCIIMRQPGQKDVTLAASREQDRDAWHTVLSTFAKAKAMSEVCALNWFALEFDKPALDIKFMAASTTSDAAQTKQKADGKGGGEVVVLECLSGGPGDEKGLLAGDVIISIAGEFVAHVPFAATLDRIRAHTSRPLRIVFGRDGEIPEGADPIETTSDTQVGVDPKTNGAEAQAVVQVGDNLMISAASGGNGSDNVNTDGLGATGPQNDPASKSTRDASRVGSADLPETGEEGGGAASTMSDGSEQILGETATGSKEEDSVAAPATSMPSHSSSTTSGNEETSVVANGEEVDVPGCGIRISNGSHNRWVEQQNKQEYVAVLADPTEEKEGGMSTKKFTAYRLTTTLAEKFWSVWRRFSDFVWLRDTLKDRYVGLCIPPLPQSIHTQNVFKSRNVSLGGRTDEAFIEVRMIGLTLFMQKVLSNVFLKNDVSVQEFLTLQDRKKFDKMKGKAGIFSSMGKGAGSPIARSGESADENLSLAHWHFVIAQYTTPENATRNVRDYRLQLQQLQKEYTALLKVADALGASILEQYHAQQALHVALDRLCEVDENNNDVGKNEYVPSSAGGRYLNSLQDLRAVADQRTQTALERSPQFCLTLQSMISYAICETEAMLDLLKTRDEFNVAAAKSRQALEKLKSDISKNGPSARRTQQLKQLELQFARRNARAIFIDKGMLLYTIRKFQRERKAHFIEALLQWAFVVRTGHEREQQHAANVLRSLQTRAGKDVSVSHKSTVTGVAAEPELTLQTAVCTLKALFERTPELVAKKLADVALEGFDDVEALEAAAAFAGRDPVVPNLITPANSAAATSVSQPEPSD